MSLRAFLLSTSFSVVCVASQAQSYDQSIDCDRVDKKGGNGYELGQCAARARLEVQFQFEQVVKQLTATLGTGSGQNALLESQRRWIAWKDKEADLCAHAQGFGPQGSAYGMVWSNCAANITRERTKVLREYLRELQHR